MRNTRAQAIAESLSINDTWSSEISYPSFPFRGLRLISLIAALAAAVSPARAWPTARYAEASRRSWDCL